MGTTPESPQRSCGGYIRDRLGDHCVCGGQRFLHNLTAENLDPNHSRRNRKRQEMPCSGCPSARNEVRIVESRLAVCELGAVERRDPPARRDDDGVSGGGIPFHGAAKPRIEIGDALGDEAELQRAAGGAVAAHAFGLQERLMASASPWERLDRTMTPSPGTLRAAMARAVPARRWR